MPGQVGRSRGRGGALEQGAGSSAASAPVEGIRDALLEEAALTRELAVGIGEAETVEEALAVALRTIAEWTGWAIGQAWIRDGAPRLEYAASWYAVGTGFDAFREQSRKMRFEPGVGLPGQAWQQKRAVWSDDVRSNPDFLRVEAARAVGLAAGMAVPVLARDEVVAALEFFAPQARERDRHVIRLVSAAAAQLGSLIEHKRSEDALRKSEARYRLLAVNSTDVISVTDPKGVIRYVSPASTAMTGWTPDELVGRSGYELVHPDDLRRVVQAFDGLLAREQPVTGPPYRVARKQGGWVWVETTVRPIRDPESGEVVEVQASARDVTRRRITEEALERAYAELERTNVELERSNVELEQFAYDASHDLGEPLRVMSQLALRLCEDHGAGMDEEGRRLAASIVDGLDRMQTLIADLLEYSRVSREPAVHEDVDCAAVLAETLELLEETIAEKEARVEAGALPVVRAHPTQLGQVFQNLLSNALKFSRDDASLTVAVSAERGAGAWRFTFADNGIGIDPKQSERVFEMFRRLNPRDAYAGTGMGLSICKRIVERHGGRIWVEQQPQGGSAFCFTIPDRAPGAISNQ